MLYNNNLISHKAFTVTCTSIHVQLIPNELVQS